MQLIIKKTIILKYLDVVAVDTLVVVGVETLDDVDTDDDVETELDVDTLKAEENSITTYIEINPQKLDFQYR